MVKPMLFLLFINNEAAYLCFKNCISAIAVMNSTLPDVEIQAAQACMRGVASVEVVAPKPKRMARSRELAMLLENITNLAPSPNNSSDSDSRCNAGDLPRLIAGNSNSGKKSKRISPPQSLVSAAIVPDECHATQSDAVTPNVLPISQLPSAPVRINGDSGQPASEYNSGSRTQQQQLCNVLQNVSSYRSQVGESVEVSVMGSTGLVYGDIVYADDSSLAAAAVHAGLLSLGESKCIRIFILGPYKGFVSSVRNDIKSFSYPKWPGSFAFVPDALEQAALAAAQRKRAVQERRAAAKSASTRRDGNSSGSDSSHSCSSSDLDPVAAHWDTPAVPEHLNALAQSGTFVGEGICFHESNF